MNPRRNRVKRIRRRQAARFLRGWHNLRALWRVTQRTHGAGWDLDWETWRVKYMRDLTFHLKVHYPQEAVYCLINTDRPFLSLAALKHT